MNGEKKLSDKNRFLYVSPVHLRVIILEPYCLRVDSYLKTEVRRLVRGKWLAFESHFDELVDAADFAACC